MGISPTPSQTSTQSQMSSASHGNQQKTSPSRTRFPSSVSNGTFAFVKSPFPRPRRRNTSTRSLCGRARENTTSRTRRSFMESSYMPASWFPQDAPTLPRLKHSWEYSPIVLSCHVPHPDILKVIFSGGKNDYATPTSPDPSQVQYPSSTTMLTQTLAQRWALESPSATTGGPGGSCRVGKPTDVTLAGQKPSVSSSSVSLSATHTPLLVLTSKLWETTVVSSKGGGQVAAATAQPTSSSETYTTSLKRRPSPSTPSTFPVKKTRQMVPHGASTAQTLSFSNPSSYLPTSQASSQTSTMLPSLLSSVLYGNGGSCSHPLSSANEARIPESLKPALAYRALHQPAPSSLSTRSSNPAPYLKDLSPLPSVQRPHVLARDRLRLWLPLAPRNTLDQEGHPTNLTSADLERIREVMEDAWAGSTRETYGSGLLIFHVFCDKKNISEAQRAPASPILIASFIATLSGTYSGTAITNFVCGIRAWHVLHGMSWHMNTAEVDTLLKAAKKSAPPTSKRKKRQPYTIDFMISIRNNLDLTNPLHAAVFACLTTTFYAAARVGEFTTKTLKDFHPSKHVKPANVRVEVDRNGFSSTIFVLPITKSEPINGEEVSWCKQNGDTDPEAALKHHLTTNTPPPNGPLFAYRSGSSSKSLTKTKFIKTLATAAIAAGRDPRQGHGIRIGATLEYLLRGTPFEVMKVKGRWASDAFLAYLRKHAQILAPYMQANPARHDEFIRVTMPPIHR
jgi:hypothetical protein